MFMPHILNDYQVATQYDLSATITQLHAEWNTQVRHFIGELENPGNVNHGSEV